MDYEFDKLEKTGDVAPLSKQNDDAIENDTKSKD